MQHRRPGTLANFSASSEPPAPLRFDAGKGQIWLGERRMVLVHTRAIGVLRSEVVTAVGPERARAIFTRQGYESGAMDAQGAYGADSHDRQYQGLAGGPQLHALEGAARVETVAYDVDVAAGRFAAEYIWEHSAECLEHLDIFGSGLDPAGWAQIGYASGYASIFMGRPIVYREIECVAMGHKSCRIVGKCAEDWPDPEVDLQYMRSDALVASRRRFASTGVPGATSTGPDRWRMVGTSPSFNSAFDMLSKVAKTDATVLLQGESGVGKEMFARNLHELSRRHGRTFVAVNCAAIPETLMEAELFGVERGAYTSASTKRAGRFERADGGTLFLDEIGTLSLAAQAKLLRALQEGEIERVGGTQVRKVDVRVVAATNIDLRLAVDRGEFRQDLYYRLNVFPLRVAPLRERRSDIPLLLEHFITKYCAEFRKQITGLDDRAVEAILNYDWPGNVRELENAIARAVILADNGGPLHVAHLFASGEQVVPQGFGLNDQGAVTLKTASGDAAGPVADALDTLIQAGLPAAELEQSLIAAALRRANGNRSAAARSLGLTRATFNYREAKRRAVAP